LLGLTGADSFTLQRVAGHANISTTMKYVHPTPESMKSAFKMKVQKERRDRRVAGKNKGKVVTMPSAVKLMAAVAG